MPDDQPTRPRATETRLDALRDEARRAGIVQGAGAAVVGGPIPHTPGAATSYYGQPIIKAPVWTWQIGLYFFVGGTAGMSGVLALAGLLTGESRGFLRAALAIALAGAVLSPCLLIWDLGRPTRFLTMLRVFKWRSAMSMGVWTLVLFSGFAGAAVLTVEGGYIAAAFGVPRIIEQGALVIGVSGTAIFGAILATYTGVLLGATAVPAWAAHHTLLPFHFGIVALGSAAALLELLGFRPAALNVIGLAVCIVETGIGAWIEGNRASVTARALHRGPAGRLLRTAGVLTGPIALMLRFAGWTPIAASCFLIGAVLSRYGWIFAGRASALDPQETIAAQE
jgi:hypothetical protein